MKNQPHCYLAGRGMNKGLGFRSKTREGEVEGNPQLSRDCLLSRSSLALMEFISICTENYSSAVVVLSEEPVQSLPQQTQRRTHGLIGAMMNTFAFWDTTLIRM
jgi:hypothetical protein